VAEAQEQISVEERSQSTIGSSRQLANAAWQRSTGLPQSDKDPGDCKNHTPNMAEFLIKTVVFIMKKWIIPM
jgi:hypothetical protein